MKTIYSLAEQIGQLLQTKKLLLVTAESCTGGQIAEAITQIPGCSGWFDRGFITYSNNAKQEMLGVKKNILEQKGAVSAETAKAMAEGALQQCQADVSIAVTGIAGPGGGSAEKPVGTVYLGWSIRGQITQVEAKHFSGDRQAIRSQTTTFALQHLLELLKKP